MKCSSSSSPYSSGFSSTAERGALVAATWRALEAREAQKEARQRVLFWAVVLVSLQISALTWIVAHLLGGLS